MKHWTAWGALGGVPGGRVLGTFSTGAGIIMLVRKGWHTAVSMAYLVERTRNCMSPSQHCHIADKLGIGETPCPLSVPARRT